MTTLLGRSEEPWPLARAVDALTAAAARAGVPGLVWVAGIVYPSLSVSVDLAQGLIAVIESVAGADLPGGGVGLGPVLRALGLGTFALGDDVKNALAGTALLVGPLFVLYRLVAGLARVSDPWLWDGSAEVERGFAFVLRAEVGDLVRSERHGSTVPLRAVWRAGKGLAGSALGLSVVLTALLCAATVALLGTPVFLARLFGLGLVMPLLVLYLVPALVVLLAYALMLQVVGQLALHSLVHNRRGVASALTHAWRLVQSAPASVARAALLELLLWAAVTLGARGPRMVFGEGSSLAALVLVALLGFAGVTRAGFWARAYRDLGGLGSADRVPGLS